MKTQTIAIDKLIQNPNNPRVIKDHAFAKLVQSVKDFPDMLKIRPIVVNTSLMVLGGNMRLKACQEAGIRKIPVIIADLSPEQEKEFIVKDNISGGEWNWEQLVADWDVSKLEIWGLDIPEFTSEQPVEDDYEIPEEIKTDIVIGDLFEIGQHRLICGDSTSENSVSKIMNGKIADLYITDPPYGVKYEGKTKRKLRIENDELSTDDTHKLWADVFNTFITILKPGGSIYVTVPPGLLQVGFMQTLLVADCLHQCMVWNKGSMVMGHSDYHYKHEPILYGWRPGAKHYFTKDRTQTTVFDVAKPSRNAEHPTMKPIELWSKFINNSSRPSELVVDSFLGSGTTMLAAHQLKRICYGVELDPKYCAVIIDRMLTFDPSLVVKRNGKPYKINTNKKLNGK